MEPFRGVSSLSAIERRIEASFRSGSKDGALKTVRHLLLTWIIGRSGRWNNPDFCLPVGATLESK